MVKIKVNLDDISSFSVIEPGKYQAKLVDVIEAESSTGNPMLVWTWRVENEEDKELKSFVSLQTHALFGLKEHLEAFGVAGQVDFNTDKLIGKRAVLSVIKTTVVNRNNGEDMEVNRIEAVLPAKKASGKGKAVSKAKIENGEGNDIPF